MVGLRLILLVTVLIISEATDDECKSGKKEVCALVKTVLHSNMHALNLMVGALDGRGKKALVLADKWVAAVLKTTEEQLISGLEKALRGELSAYVQIKADCFKLGHDYNETCKRIFFEVAHAATGLILAILEVDPNEGKKIELDKRFSVLTELVSGNENDAFFLGKNISSNI